jgi:hypothetical protein
MFHQNADFRVVLGEPGRARPAQLIERSISKTGMPEMAGQNGPENDGAKISLSRRVSSLRPTA